MSSLRSTEWIWARRHERVTRRSSELAGALRFVGILAPFPASEVDGEHPPRKMFVASYRERPLHTPPEPGRVVDKGGRLSFWRWRHRKERGRITVGALCFRCLR
eukprot:3532749-Prymnesium_polylepis.1